MKRKAGSPVADWHLWSAVKRTVKPLRAERETQAPDLPLPLPPALGFGPSVLIANPARGTPLASSPRAQRQADPGIEPRLRRKLGRGQIEIDGTIDLHGMRQSEARLALQRFIHRRAALGDRTVLVITGKGLKKVDGDGARIIERGVLRSMLPVWLSEPELAPLVSGWHSAAQAHGGEGAFYVRLRRGRR